MGRKLAEKIHKKIKITLEGEKEYIEELQEMKDATAELRKEIEQLNIVLERELELLQRLRGMKRDDIEETMQLINQKIKKKCNQEGNSPKEIYLLTLALKEMNQLEPNPTAN